MKKLILTAMILLTAMSCKSQLTEDRDIFIEAQNKELIENGQTTSWLKYQEDTIIFTQDIDYIAKAAGMSYDALLDKVKIKANMDLVSKEAFEGVTRNQYQLITEELGFTNYIYIIFDKKNDIAYSSNIFKL